MTDKDYINAVAFPQTISMQPIGIIRSPYRQRHGTPRQSQLKAAPQDYESVIAQIEVFTDIVPHIALKDLDGFDYIWVISWLHLNRHWNPTVRIPRGPNVRRGTLATRAPHRPNPIGLSALKLISVQQNIITVEGIDLLADTPVLDIKPYVPYCDAFPHVRSGYVESIEACGEHEQVVLGHKTFNHANLPVSSQDE